MKLNQPTWSIVVVLTVTAAASLGALFFAPFRPGQTGIVDRAILIAYIVVATAIAIRLGTRRR